MSVWAEQWAYQQTTGNAGTKFVLVSLASFADESGFCYPSQETLAAMTEQGVSTVRRQLADLEKTHKLIKRTHRYIKNQGRTSDGFNLLGPQEAFRPNRAVAKKSLPLKSSTATAQIEQSVLKHSAQIERGSIKEERDLLKENNKTIAQALRAAQVADTSRLMQILRRETGPIANTAAQAKAIKWLLDHGYTVGECEACLQALCAQEWRTTTVSWWTVTKEIEKHAKQSNRGRQLTEDQKAARDGFKFKSEGVVID